MDKGSEYYAMYLNGDHTGMELLIKEYSDGLKLFLNTYVQNIYTAEDLMIDTFAKIGYKKPKKKGNTSFKTWLYAIGCNVAIDYLRKNKVRHVSFDEIGDVAAEEIATYERIIIDERKMAIHTAMKRLNDDYQQVLWLFYFEKQSVKQVATIIGRSVHATENMLSRARKGLREELEKEGFSYEDL